MDCSKKEKLQKKAAKAEAEAQEYGGYAAYMLLLSFFPPLTLLTFPAALLFLSISEMESKKAEGLRRKAAKKH